MKTSPEKIQIVRTKNKSRKHSPRTRTPETLATIDIGTNSVKLVVARVAPGGKFTVLAREKHMVRLGASATDMKHLESRAIARTLDSLRIFKAIAARHHAPIRAVATSAVREALNRNELLDAARTRLGITIDVVSGTEEARLIYLGAVQALPIFQKKVLLIDIGGGSAEFVVGERGKLLYAQSLKLGAIRLTERFFPKSSMSPKHFARGITACREYVRGELAPSVRELKKFRHDIAVGCSGTIGSVATMAHWRDLPPARNIELQLNNTVLTHSDVKEITRELAQAPSLDERKQIPGLETRRADIITAGAIVLDEAFRALGIKHMTMSAFALREGLLLDTVTKSKRLATLHHLVDVRRASVLTLAERSGYNARHAEHVSKLSLEIFDMTMKLHHLGDAEREALEAAALLHDVGYHIAHANHHKHSYYLIRNAEMLGFTNEEVEVIANIARYHRKSHPKPRHENFAQLETLEEQTTVQMLSAILRIADGLDRGHNANVRKVLLKQTNLKIIFHITARRAPTIEIWSAGRKKDLFEEIFGREVEFRYK